MDLPYDEEIQELSESSSESEGDEETIEGDFQWAALIS